MKNIFKKVKERIKSIQLKRKKNILTIYFGLPGSGKTTIASAYAKKYSRFCNVYSNVPIKNTYRIEKEDIGTCDMNNGLLILDECSIEYNSRAYKDMKQSAIKWFKLHRHYGMKCVLFSQSWNDTDITLRRLAYKYYLVKSSLIPFHIVAIPIKRSIGINEMTKEPCDEYSFPHWIIRPFVSKRYFAPLYWRLFDSWEAPKLEKVINQKW